MTEFFYDPEPYKAYCEECRSEDIVPIYNGVTVFRLVCEQCESTKIVFLNGYGESLYG
ncbi:MAG: hypothetical protein ACW96U_00775 [Candidatus Heimdallarchaeaceae archaeon]|jgi:hypothetical protein